MQGSILCQGCGIEAPTRFVEFHQNIGMLVMRRSKSIKGNICKNCLHKHFWQMTGTTITVGWFGYISAVLTPFFVVNNIVRYLSAIGMPAVPAGASQPRLDDDAIAKMYPLMQTVSHRIGQGEKLDSVASELAPQAGVTPGQLFLYVRTLARSSQIAQQQQRPTGGFPVLPASRSQNAN